MSTPVRPPLSGASLNVYQRRAVSNYLAHRRASVDTLRILAVQVQFSDSLMGGQPGSARAEVRDSTFFANELKHLGQYFGGASRGKLTLRSVITSKLYSLPEAMGFYGDDELQDVRSVRMMQDVIDSVDADVDFSLYDTILLVHAGAGQETDIFDDSRVQLFSTFLDRDDINSAFADSTVAGLVTADSSGGEPVLVDNFMIVPANASQDGLFLGTLGIWCFEMGARLGLLPLFDSTPGFPDSRGIGEYDLMSLGLFVASGFVPTFPSAFNRLLAGWIDPLIVEGNGDFRLRDINTPVPADTHCLQIPISESEYFLVVNRVHDSNFDSLFTYTDFDTGFPANIIPANTDSLGGAEFDWFLTDLTNPFIVKPDPNVGGSRRFVRTGSGVYIWHIDENVIRQTLEQGFLPNDFAQLKGVDLEEADGVQDLDNVFTVFSFSSFFDSYRQSNNDRFAPATEPSSAANSGISTGVTVKNISQPGAYMTCSVEFARSYTETRARWDGSGPFQPPSVFDLDGIGGPEIIALADGGLYAFASDGSEFVDMDGDPETIEPYVAAPGAVWRGAPAFGDIDGGGDDEIVAFAEDGTVYAWKRNGTEVLDGDGIPGTIGVLFAGAPLAAPPMLIDVTGDAIYEIVVVEVMGDSLRVSFVGGGGTVVTPALLSLQSPVGRTVQAQFCSPLAFGELPIPGEDTEGVFLVFADTIQSTFGARYLPTRLISGTTATGFDVSLSTRGDLEKVFPPTSAPAIGDIDADGAEEWVLTLPGGRLVVGDRGQGQRIRTFDLRSPHPSSPALGDTDGNGTLEIALWDETHVYLFEHNGRLKTNWPQAVQEIQLGSVPELSSKAPLVSPLIVDVDAQLGTEILFPRTDGSFLGFRANGSAAPGFPRPGPAALGATPTVAALGAGSLSLVALASVPLFSGVDAISDTIITNDEMVLSIQSLPGSSAGSERFWSAYQHDLTRRGRVTESSPLKSAVGLVESSFIVYPNPVRDGTLNARIVLNGSATVRVEIYNLEGERAIERVFSANPTGAPGVPFDERIDVSRLDSGVYFLRMSVEGAGGPGRFIKTFAVLQ